MTFLCTVFVLVEIIWFESMRRAHSSDLPPRPPVRYQGPSRSSVKNPKPTAVQRLIPPDLGPRLQVYSPIYSPPSPLPPLPPIPQTRPTSADSTKKHIKPSCLSITLSRNPSPCSTKKKLLRPSELQKEIRRDPIGTL